MTNTYKMKEATRHLQSKEWDAKKDQVLKKVIKAKSSQLLELGKFLAATQARRLAEATEDKKFGYDAVVAEAVTVLSLLPKDSASKWRIHVLKAAAVAPSVSVRVAAIAGFPFLLHHCGPNTNHLVYDVLHEVLNKQDPLVMAEVANIIGPLACVVSRKAVLHHVLPDSPTKLSYQNISIQCVCCDSLPASEQCEGPRDRPKIVDPNMFNPFLSLLKTPEMHIKLKVIGSLRRLFGHISVRSNNPATVAMMEACLQLIEHPEHRVRMAFSNVVGCFVGSDLSDTASETDQRLHSALMSAATKAEKDGNLPVVETILITMGQLGRKVTSDLFFIIIVCFLDGICNPFSPLTSSIAKTQLKQMATYKGIEMKELFVQYGRKISKLVADHCLEVFTKVKCDPLEVVEEMADLFGFDSSKAFLRHTEQYMLPHLVLNGTTHASHLIRIIAKALGDPNHKNPLARNINSIFSELAISKNENELVKAVAFLEAETDWSLPTILRLGQHVDSELLLHLSTNYLEVLRGIKIYLRELGFTQNEHITDEQVADMLQPKLLGILVHFDNHLNNGTIPLHEKKQVFESVILLMKLMGPKHITSVRVRLMTTLRIGMKFGMKDQGFQELCCRAWNCFVHSIDVTALGPMLAQIVVSLQPLLKIFPKQVASILGYLIIDNRSGLDHHFHELYFVPERPELADVNAVLHDYTQAKSNAGFEQQVEQLLKGISHESQDVRTLALSKLRGLLRANHEQLHRLIGATETADPVISHLITALLAGCRESDQTFRILFGECLGELGAIDPGRLELMSSASKDEVTKFHSSVAEDLFAVDLINTLAKAFLRAEERGKQDCVAFAIQELIRAYGMGPDSSTPEHGQRLWSRFSDEVQEIMEPLTRSKYSLNMAYDWSSLHKPIYRSRKGNTFTMWVTTLTCYLISKVTHGKAKQVFDTCRAVVKSDQHLALYLLPHVAVQVLLDGTRDDHNELKEEMVAVLKHAEERDTRQGQDTSDLRFMCAQCVFSLLDHFTKWIRQRIMTLSYKDLSSRSKAASTTERPPSSEDAPYQAVFGFLGQIQEDILARASLNCGAYMRALMHIEQFIKLHPERLGEHLDFQQKLYVALDEPDGVAGITATKTTRPTLSEQILAYQSIDQLSDASVCFDQVIQQEPGDLSYRQGLLQCRLALGELQSTMDLANGMIADRPIWGASLNAYRVEAAWKLGQWNKLGQFLKAEGQSHGWTVGLGKVLYAVKMRNEPEFVDTLQRLRDGLMTPLSAASMEVGSYHRGYESIVRLHMLNELEQGVKCLVGFPRDPPKGAIDISSSSCSNQDAPLTVDQLKQQWESRLQFTQSAFRTQEPILTLRRTLLSLGREERNLQLDKNIGQCWLQTAKVARECRLLQTAHSSLVSAAAYDLAHISVEQAKWLWDRGDYDMAQSTLEKALEQHYPHRSEFKSEDTSWEHEDRFECAQMLLLLSQYCEETASMESNLMLKQYKEVHKVLNDWEDGYFFLAKYYDKMMTKLISNDRPEKKGDFVLHVVQHFGNSLLYGNQYIYESMPRMLSLWLDYGAEVVEYQLKMKNEVSLQGMRAMLSQLNKSMSNYTNKLAPYQFLTAFPQLTSRICHAHPDVFSQLCDLIAKLLVEFPQQTMWMMMAVSKSSYQIRMKRCQEIFAKAKGLRSELTKFLQDATKLTDRLLDLCNRPCEPSLSTLSIKQNFKQLLRVITDNNFSSILLPLQSLMTVTLPGNTTGSTSHDPFPMDQVYIKDIEDTVELLPSLQRPKKITMRGSDGKLYVMLAKPKDDLRKDARLMEFNTIINKFLRKNYESRRRDLHIRTFTVTPLNEECGLLEWVSNTSGFRNILMKLYREKNMYTNGKELRSMALPANAPKQRKLEMYKDKLLRRHPAVFSDWFLKTFPDPTSWYNARLSYARTTGVMSIVGYILGLGDRHGENILFDSTNGDVVHVDFSCLFNKGESFDFPEIVPFRLTHNMVEAMGPTGVEGVFRRACEVTLRVMRNQSDPLMSVLKTFIYDPLVEWSKPAKGRSESGEIKNEKGYMHVNNIELRLKGLLKNKAKPHGLQLSVEGHVNHLIKEATDENNLCQMYIGWAPYM